MTRVDVRSGCDDDSRHLAGRRPNGETHDWAVQARLLTVPPPKPERGNSPPRGVALPTTLRGDEFSDSSVRDVRSQRKSVVDGCPRGSSSVWMDPMTDTNSKPEVDAPEGPAPVDLVIEDIVVGDGAEATPGSTVDVHYLGVEYDSGEEFDSSWGRGQSINFPLQALIAGWQEGIPGMKVGGRRKLTVPPQKAYGPAGGGHQLSGKTLIFVIDLLGVS